MRNGVCLLVTVGLFVGVGTTGCGEADVGSGELHTPRVGVILPDDDLPRWEGADRPYLDRALTSAGVLHDIRNAQGDPQAFQEIADEMIVRGTTVLMIASVDAESGSAVIDKARALGVTVIDYDRPTLGGGADYFVGYDGFAAGRLQADGLVGCLSAAGITRPVVAQLGGSPTDTGAAMWRTGYESVLQPRFDATEFTAGPTGSVPDWDSERAKEIFGQMMTRSGNRIDGVVAANDDIGNAVIAVLRLYGLNGRVAVTGQDATVQGLRNLLSGDQCVTVYKPVKQGAAAAAALAAAVAKGEPINTGQTFTDPLSGTLMPARVLKPVAVTRANVKQIVEDGDVTREELCTAAYVTACDQAGIS